jgi:CubicO group peptidase (beta-lactamase class C family)
MARLRTAAFTLAVCGVTPTAQPALAQAVDTAAIDAVFAAFDSPGSPGCALGVVQSGRLVYERGYGSANLDYGLPNAPHMVYYVGSVSKQFTAAAVALLAAEGRISLDDDVRRWIPELPDYGRVMTVRHLVHHTSGLRDIYTLMDLAGLRLQDVLTDHDALALIARQAELNFLPGDDYLYSNSGYWLLGQVVARATGSSLREYAAERIFSPLGMVHTQFHDRADRVMPNRVLSYGGTPGDYRLTYIFNFDEVGAGGLYTTLGDLARWDANFYDPKVGGPELLATLLTPGVLASGEAITYAFGNTVDRRRGLHVVRHRGALMGFRADLVRYPSERFSVITLCNHGAIDAAALADRVTDVFLANRLTAEPARPPQSRPAAGQGRQGAVTAPAAAQLARLAGRYHSAELDATWSVELDGTRLRLSRRGALDQWLEPRGNLRFTAGSYTLTFTDEGGSVTGFRVAAGRVRNISFERTP